MESHVTATWPLHTPASQASWFVQALLSLQVVSSGLLVHAVFDEAGTHASHELAGLIDSD
jgi:hypothetical protein